MFHSLLNQYLSLDIFATYCFIAIIDSIFLAKSLYLAHLSFLVWIPWSEIFG